MKNRIGKRPRFWKKNIGKAICCKQKSERMKKAVCIFPCMILCLLFPYTACAKENTNSNSKAVVFVLDASGSMKTNDPQRYAIDSIAQLVCTLPTDYEIGFVAYNTEVCASMALSDCTGRDQILKTAGEAAYDGYSNAGAGLAQAMDLLASASVGEKSIVLLSDGEFLMKDETLTEESRRAYQNASDAAVRDDIKIHVVGLGEEMEDTENSIFRAAALTGGGIYYAPQALELSAAMESILTDRLGIKQMTAAIVDADGETEHVAIELPFSHADIVRVLLTSDSPVQSVKTNFKADGAEQITGGRYSLIEIESPQDNRIEVSFIGTTGSQVRVTLIPEYRVTAKVNITYEDKVPEDETAVCYDREAVLEYTFFDADNENIQLWTEDYFAHGRIGIQTGEQTGEKALEEGRLTDRRAVTENLTERVSFDCSALPANILVIEDIELNLEKAPLLPVPEPEPPYILYGIIAAAVAGITGVLIFWKPKAGGKNNAVSMEDERPAPGRSSYVGKLNIYITRTPSGYDIHPISYDLFRLPSTKVISVAEVLESCGVKEIFEGADRIYLSSGQGKSVILTNQSDCCIMKSGEILMKKKSYTLSEDAKVDIMFEDETSELTFQYKVLKPSEMA